MCELIHCVQRYTAVRSPFRVDCEKIPLSQFFYTSAAIDAIDKYQVWMTVSSGTLASTKPFLPPPLQFSPSGWSGTFIPFITFRYLNIKLYYIYCLQHLFHVLYLF